jgi:hypothetical protein
MRARWLAGAMSVLMVLMSISCGGEEAELAEEEVSSVRSKMTAKDKDFIVFPAQAVKNKSVYYKDNVGCGRCGSQWWANRIRFEIKASYQWKSSAFYLFTKQPSKKAVVQCR